jgi:hypothetical protein
VCSFDEVGLVAAATLADSTDPRAVEAALAV